MIMFKTFTPCEKHSCEKDREYGPDLKSSTDNGHLANRSGARHPFHLIPNPRVRRIFLILCFRGGTRYVTFYATFLLLTRSNEV